MTNGQTAMVIGGTLGLALFVAAGIGLFGSETDEQQIDKALKNSIQASKEGRAGGVLEYLSRDFALNEQKFSGMQISQRIKESKPNVEVLNPKPTIGTDGTATIESPVKLSLSLPPISLDLQKVTITFEREDARRMLFFPTKQWRMKEVRVSDETYQELSSKYGGI